MSNGSTAQTTSITAREVQQINEANSSGRQPVVFIHGLWLLPSSWDKWAEFFKQAGYAGADARRGPTIPRRSSRHGQTRPLSPRRTSSRLRTTSPT